MIYTEHAVYPSIDDVGTARWQQGRVICSQNPGASA
jgi:hypothetical protein